MNIKRIVLLGIVLLMTPISYAQRYALVIGNSNYGADIGALKNPVNDANDMSVLLKRKQFNVTTLTNANQRQMEQGITKFTKQLNEKNAVGLFFYAGHGVEVGGRNYLIPLNANINGESDVKYEAVDAGRVMSGMEYAGNNLNLVILDACRNNPFARSFRSASRGLARMDPPKGSLILYATSPGDVAADGSGRNGLFTKHLLKAMDIPNFTVEDVFKTTAIRVYKETSKKQLPWQSGVILGEFSFTSNTPEPSQKPSQEKASLTIKTSPDNAKVRILNINPKYQQGIKLKPGSYHIEVTHPGYQRYIKWIELEEKDLFHSVVLDEKEQVGTVKPDNKKPLLTPYQDSYSGIEFIPVKAGCFQMGSNAGHDDEKPVHHVCLSAYELGKYEVTQAQWQQVMGNNPSSFKGNNKPVEKVSWDDVEQFIRKLNQKTGQNYRLPTEAEWEYACRSGGKDQTYCGGNNESSVAWYGGNSGGTTHDVGQKQPNGLGFYDMSGNVWEWVQDRYDLSYYSNSPTDNPKGSSGGSERVNRGGSWGSGAGLLRSAVRGVSGSGRRYGILGFRLARTH